MTPLTKITNTAIFLLFVVGFAILAYPSFSEMYNRNLYTSEVKNYHIKLDDYNFDDYANMLDDAQRFNVKLSGEAGELTDSLQEEYDNSLNVNKGMIGYIEINKIDLSLPIYHGTSESILQKGVGHVEWSSLPTGRNGNHTIITGHTGLPSAKLFTNIDQLKQGDSFQLKILDQVFHYRIFETEVIEPHELTELTQSFEKDMVTLVTCTPYGVNSHRLLLHAVQYEPTEAELRDENYQGSSTLLKLLQVAIIVISMSLGIWGLIRWKEKYY